MTPIYDSHGTLKSDTTENYKTEDLQSRDRQHVDSCVYSHVIHSNFKAPHSNSKYPSWLDFGENILVIGMQLTNIFIIDD